MDAGQRVERRGISQVGGQLRKDAAVKLETARAARGRVNELACFWNSPVRLMAPRSLNCSARTSEMAVGATLKVGRSSNGPALRPPRREQRIGAFEDDRAEG